MENTQTNETTDDVLSESTYVVLYIFAFLFPILGIGFSIWRIVKQDVQHAVCLFIAALFSWGFWALMM